MMTCWWTCRLYTYTDILFICHCYMIDTTMLQLSQAQFLFSHSFKLQKCSKPCFYGKNQNIIIFRKKKKKKKGGGRVALSLSAVLHYISEFITLWQSQHVWPPAQDHARNSKTLGSQKSVVLSTFHDAATCASSRAHWPSCTTWQLPAIAKQ